MHACIATNSMHTYDHAHIHMHACNPVALCGFNESTTIVLKCKGGWWDPVIVVRDDDDD